ncbi:hypothetical protein [Luteolibacter sp. LG18]|uniref:hypothetical protein n=1 Tax=Luteolibacter sp. LG18 TaxID=2819286 RepID=UPI002B304C8E|nr:hypothetical protein llg_28480 [Luteolibacter sp. LG18]
MSHKAIEFLSLLRLPARLTAEQAAWLLGCQPEQMSLLVAKKVIKWLGKPVQSATKYFALSEVQALANDPKKMDQISDILYRYWQEKNSRRKKGFEEIEYREAA